MRRRSFLQASAGAGLAWAAHAALGDARALGARLVNDRIPVAVVGVRGRGAALLATCAALPDVEVRYVCDLDAAVLESRVAQVKDRAGGAPRALGDYRAALDDPAVAAVVLGTPDHWHALPTIHACQAKKDVYVEKPDGHNLIEGRTMVAAAKKHARVVQLGTQSRSGKHQRAAIAHIASGALGQVRFAKAWESSRQSDIGKPADSEPPKGFDYDTWLGPAPKRPFNVRRWHGNWRWFFDYGTGDLGNDGVHRLDVARWGLETALAARGEKLPAFPKAVASLGGKLYFDDLQEWPDTLMTTYDYGQALLTYEMRVWSHYPLHDESEGAAVYGDEGYVVIGNTRWRAYDSRGKPTREEAGGDHTTDHMRDFFQCVRTREKPAADLETIGHPSSALCHVGNAAWRAGKALRFDADKYVFAEEDANPFLTRPEYRKPWVLPGLAEV